MNVCLCCGAEYHPLQTHTAHDCAERLRAVGERGIFAVKPLRKRWHVMKKAA